MHLNTKFYQILLIGWNLKTIYNYFISSGVKRETRNLVSRRGRAKAKCRRKKAVKWQPVLMKELGDDERKLDSRRGGTQLQSVEERRQQDGNQCQ